MEAEALNKPLKNTYNSSNVVFPSVSVFFRAIKHMFRIANTFLMRLKLKFDQMNTKIKIKSLFI